MNKAPTLSVIIPTHNRCDMLARSLDALADQSWPMSNLELVVVADACEDDTVQMLRGRAGQMPCALIAQSHSARSAAATRNLGASHARGSTLLFVDDDVVAQPGFLQAHMAAQRPGRIALGYSKPMIPNNPGWWHYDARHWWEDAFTAMEQPGHRFTYRDFFSGNVSMSAALFHQVGGFDVTFKGRLEDYELGMRLLKAGARFHFVRRAVGHHHETTDLKRWLYRVRQEGIADVQIGDRHPELRTSMFEFDIPHNKEIRHTRDRAFDISDRGIKRGKRMERRLFCRATRHEHWRLRRRWRKDIRLLREFNYWRGVAMAIGGRSALAAWLQEAPIRPPLAKDAPLLELTAPPSTSELERILDRGTDAGLRLALEGIEILAIAPQYGAEPLRREHVYQALQELATQELVPPLVLHMIQEGASLPAAEERLRCISSFIK
jgi:glycosyltransferase involved in cell wall biosynthesis